MKRILMLMAMTLGLALISGCEKPAPTPNPEPKPEPPQPVLQSFEVAVNAVTETSMTYTVTPSVLDQEYIAVVKTKESLAALQDEQIVEAVFEDIKAAAASSGITFNEKMAAIAAKGVSENVEITGLAVDTEYSLVVFGVDPSKDWEYTTFPVVKDFKTNAVEVVEYTFDVTATVEYNTVSFQVVPSDNTVAWHLLTVTKEMYDYYTDDFKTFYEVDDIGLNEEDLEELKMIGRGLTHFENIELYIEQLEYKIQKKTTSTKKSICLTGKKLQFQTQKAYI